MIQFSNKKLDDAYDVGNMIVQVAKDGEPVLIEILDASQFLKQVTSKLPTKIKQEILNEHLPLPQN